MYVAKPQLHDAHSSHIVSPAVDALLVDEAYTPSVCQKASNVGMDP